MKYSYSNGNDAVLLCLCLMTITKVAKKAPAKNDNPVKIYIFVSPLSVVLADF